MKIIYSELKQLLPNLSVNAIKLRDDLTQIGHFVSGFEKIDNETVLDLEIRQNRGDCLGYYGIARDLAVLYDIKLHLPELEQPEFGSEEIPISIKSADVYRIQSTKISNINNSSLMSSASKYSATRT